MRPKTPASSNPEWLGLDDAADYLSTSTRTIRRRIADGALPGYRFGRELRVNRADLDRLLRQVPAVRAELAGLGRGAGA